MIDEPKTPQEMEAAGSACSAGLGPACMLKEWNECCCTCKHHLQDFHHCTTKPGRQPGTCVCSEPKGWICMPPDFDRAHSGWSEHGLCELHTPRTA